METAGLLFTQKERAMSRSSSDIISNLPSDVLEQILVCLTVQDAVRTSVLSRKWRYIWTTLPVLIFDDKFCRESVIRTRSDKLVMTIYKVLLLHDGPITKFTLALENLENSPEIDQLIFSVSKNGIREFTLHIWKGKPFKLPSTLFSCQRLEHLSLCSCVFKPPPRFKGFTRLLSLELYEVFIAGDLLSSLTSNCPLLEQLTLHCSTSYDYLEIGAPSLKYFECEGLVRCICFRNTPHIEEVATVLEGSRNQLGINYEGDISNSLMTLCGTPMVDLLILDHAYVKVRLAY